jgi:hypothetical protein
VFPVLVLYVAACIDRQIYLDINAFFTENTGCVYIRTNYISIRMSVMKKMGHVDTFIKNPKYEILQESFSR